MLANTDNENAGQPMMGGSPLSDLPVSSELLKQAKEEIERLRTRNHYMGGRLDMFDDMMMLIRTRVSSHGSELVSNGMDTLRRLDNAIYNMEKYEEEKKKFLQKEKERDILSPMAPVCLTSKM